MNNVFPFLVAAALFLGAGLWLDHRQQAGDAQVLSEMAELKRQADARRVQDSLALAIERQSRDSLALTLAESEARIRRLEKSLSTLKKQSDELEQKYHALTVVMPEF